MNELAEFFSQAFEVIWTNRLRSLLTMLGLIIGVGSVIAILAVGDSTTKSVLNILSPYSLSSSFIIPKQQQPDPLLAQIRYDDAQRVKLAVPDAKDVLPLMALPMETRVRHEDKTVRVVTAGPGSGWDSTPLSEGRYFNDQDLASHRRVAILSAQTRDELLGTQGSALGQVVRLNGSDFEVVGVQAPPVNQGLLGGNTNGLLTVVIPYTLIPELGYTYVFGLTIVAPDPSSVVHVSNEAIAALKKIHGARAQYEERDIQQLNQGIERVFGILTGVISVVAGISLVVGGVGIMNIMLVSVTERTREIGIRLAIGATEDDVRQQFLIESVLIGLIGGAIGIAFGVVSSLLVSHTLGWPILIPPSAILASTIFALMIGTFFGFYPANKAAQLNPIEALRYE